MSVHLLDVAPSDVDADALGLVVDAPAPKALAELHLRDAEAGALTLGVLGASHVVIASAPGRRFTEQVSCDARRAGGRDLPELDERAGYRFVSRVERVSADELARRAARLRVQAGGDDWICGAFPGDRDALTALTATANDGEWRWRTWHLYPGPVTGTVVETESRWRP